MRLIEFFKSRRIIFLLGVVLLLIIAGVFYFSSVSQPEGQEEVILKDSTAPSPTPVSAVASSPISPLSPISAISPLAQSKPEEIEARLQQGIALHEAQKYQEALEVFNQVLASDPDNILAINARGSISVDTQDYQSGIADFSKAIELEPLFSPAYYNRGRAYFLQKKYDEALADLRKSVELSPAEFGYRANGNIGLIYHQLGEYDKALEAFAESISGNTEQKADVYYFRAETYTALQNYEAAIADYQAAIERFSTYDLAYQSLGYAYYKADQPDKAIEALGQSLEIASDNPVSHFYLILAYLATGQDDKATTAAVQATEFINNLAEEKREFILTRVLTDLETFAADHPDQAETVDPIMDSLPKP